MLAKNYSCPLTDSSNGGHHNHASSVIHSYDSCMAIPFATYTNSSYSSQIINWSCTCSQIRYQYDQVTIPRYMSNSEI